MKDGGRSVEEEAHQFSPTQLASVGTSTSSPTPMVKAKPKLRTETLRFLKSPIPSSRGLTSFGGSIALFFLSSTVRVNSSLFKYTCELVVAEGKNLEEAAAWRTITFSFVTLPDFDNYCVIGTTLEPDQIIFQGWDNKVSLFFVNLTTGAGACSMAPVHGLEPPRIRLDKHKVMAFDHADSMAFLN
uniref:Uncharacterized protein n=1 Tax=Noccaea caerulescens TaxID=107243 RepID=A0A1J3CDZ0_NOCCA